MDLIFGNFGGIINLVMKTLIAYYSRSGSNKKLAQEIKEKLNCEIEEIIDTVNRKGFLGFIVGGFHASSKKKTKIQPIQKNPANYDLIIIITPLWAEVVSPAIRTYISENKDKFKKIAFISVSGSGEPNAKKTMPDLMALAGKEDILNLFLSQKEFKKENYTDKLERFLKKIKTV